jgi:hypothetical protein
LGGGIFLFLFFCKNFAKSPGALTAHVFQESGGRLSTKIPFTERISAERPLPRATLGKPFAESKPLFAECIGHLTKPRFPVEITYDIHVNPK